MKYIFKFFMLIFIGSLSTIVIYPFLHETGHCLAGILVGARIVKFSIIPLPYVVCEISNVSNIGIQIISLSGIVFPFIFIMILRTKKFWVWYCCFIINFISIISFVFSILAILFSYFGIMIDNDDILQSIVFYEGNSVLFLLVLLVCLITVINYLKKQKPISKILIYFY